MTVTTLPTPLPVGWSWRVHPTGVLVISFEGVAAGWVALSDQVPFTAALANRITRDLAHDGGG